MPHLQEFYEYFKYINAADNSEYFDFRESIFDITNSEEILNSKILASEISSAILGLKLGKAPGYDEILNEYIKFTEEVLMPLYVKFLNVIFETGILPEVWLQGKIRPIYKSKGD